MIAIKKRESSFILIQMYFFLENRIFYFTLKYSNINDSHAVLHIFTKEIKYSINSFFVLEIANYTITSLFWEQIIILKLYSTFYCE